MNMTKPKTGFWCKYAWLILIAVLLVGHAETYSQNRAQQNTNVNSLRGVSQPLPIVGGGIIRPGDLDKWMYSRIIWVTIFSGIAGFLLSWFYLTRLSFEDGLETERKARKIFFITLLFIVLPIVLLLLYADMYFYWFIGYLGFTVLGALFGLQGLLLTIAALLAFTLASALTTHFKPSSRGPYMLWRKPKGK